jgi:hypothetical protein
MAALLTLVPGTKTGTKACGAPACATRNHFVNTFTPSAQAVAFEAQRKSLGLTRAEAGLILGFTQPGIRHMEEGSGVPSNPTTDWPAAMAALTAGAAAVIAARPPGTVVVHP